MPVVIQLHAWEFNCRYVIMQEKVYLQALERGMERFAEELQEAHQEVTTSVIWKKSFFKVLYLRLCHHGLGRNHRASQVAKYQHRNHDSKFIAMHML